MPLVEASWRPERIGMHCQAHQNNAVLLLEIIITASETEEQGLMSTMTAQLQVKNVMKWSHWHVTVSMYRPHRDCP